MIVMLKFLSGGGGEGVENHISKVALSVCDTYDKYLFMTVADVMEKTTMPRTKKGIKQQ